MQMVQHNVDWVKIEEEARQMRADAIRYGMTETAKWFGHVLSRIGFRGQSPA